MFALQRTLKSVFISGNEGLLSNFNISAWQKFMEESHCWQIHQLSRPNAHFQSQYVKQSHFVQWILFFSEIFICPITKWNKWNGSVAEFREDFLRNIGMWSKYHHYIVVQWKESLNRSSEYCFRWTLLLKKFLVILSSSKWWIHVSNRNSFHLF